MVDGTADLKAKLALIALKAATPLRAMIPVCGR